MKIAKVEAMVLKAPVPGIESWRAASFALPFRFAETTLVRVETDAGITGWGEVHAPVAPEVAKKIVDVLLGPAVVGQDPLQPAVL